MEELPEMLAAFLNGKYSLTAMLGLPSDERVRTY
jgi:hypothetical protein